MCPVTYSLTLKDEKELGSFKLGKDCLIEKLIWVTIINYKEDFLVQQVTIQSNIKAW